VPLRLNNDHSICTFKKHVGNKLNDGKTLKITLVLATLGQAS
jgi:hypothetical protein